ncbi:MAG: universal stress protein [Acidimicrobiales bacterium]
MVTSVLVPLDGSDTSAGALSLADRYARAEGVGLEVIHIEVPGPRVGRKTLEKQLRDAGVEPHRATIHMVATSAPMVSALAEIVSRATDSMVCLASTGRGRSGAAAGSTAVELVRLVETPVIVIGPEGRDRGCDGPVLVALDRDRGAHRTAAFAHHLAGVLGTGSESVPLDLDAEPAVIADSLIEQAADRDASLLALATPAAPGRRDLVAEGVALRVLLRAACPVLLARAGASLGVPADA